MGCANSTARATSPTSATSHSLDQTRIPAGRAGSRSIAPPAPQQQQQQLQRRPLRPPRAYRNNDSNPTHALWTPAAIRRERRIFFETRVSGAPEIWQAVALAVEMVRGAPGDLVGAQSVLDAAGVVVPRGRLEEGAWDERGMLYPLPAWVLGDPVDMPLDEEEEEGSDGVGAAGEEDDDDEEKEALDGRERRPGELVSIRARLSDRGTDVIFSFDKERNVSALGRAVREAADMPSKTKIRIAYLGRILKDNQTLSEQGWEKGHVVNALVFA